MAMELNLPSVVDLILGTEGVIVAPVEMHLAEDIVSV